MNEQEAIAIVGMGCRFPGGATSPERFWELLCNGEDAITDVPPSRWDVDAWFDPAPDAPGKMISRRGSFLQEVDQFDPEFFGISPREAIDMDPQQRLLLEVAWEALERAGQPIDGLQRSATGVFVGMSGSDYFQLQQARAAPGAHVATGNLASFAAGRLSYLLDLRGPSLCLDTACSSSLVAVHLACQSLRSGECEMALAGGVNLILTPTLSVLGSRLQALSPDGACKTFDASANGFVRGEGCGIVVLKRLSDALANQDPILAVVRGSAVNQDGRSTRLTAPNGLAQQALIRQALANAGLTSDQVHYVETHGTGTALGDPIEVDALRTVLDAGGQDAPPCLLGALKSNIGHLEAAAGIAGLIKTILAIQHAAIPPNLHLRQLNPYINLAGSRFILPTTLQPWPEGQRVAGVSAFGMSGTNAHILLAEAPALSPPLPAEAESWLIPFSARGPEALRAMARALHDALAAPEGAPLADVAYTLACRRTHHEHRLALVGQSGEEVREQVAAFLAGENRPALSVGLARARRQPRIAFVFSGQGASWGEMGRSLLAQEPVFRTALERCDALIRSLAGWSLLDQLQTEADEAWLARTDVAQLVLFSLQVALTALWNHWGVWPQAVVGHSVGEVAAAHVVGILTLEESISLVFHRGRLMHQTAGQGAMIAIELPQAEVEAWCAAGDQGLVVAAFNSPTSVVLAGTEAALDEAIARARLEGRWVHPINPTYAFHSPQMEPLRAPFIAHLKELVPRSATIPFFSTVTGERCDGTELEAAYWGRNLREAVRFAPTIARVQADGYTHFLEIGPHPTLGRAIAETAGIPRAQVLSSLRRDTPERAALLATLSALYVQGTEVRWTALHPTRRAPLPLPTYPWQRTRYWLDTPTLRPAAPAPEAAEAEPPPVITQPEATPDLSEATLPAYLRQVVAEVMRVDLTRLDPEYPLNQMGLDSLLALEIKTRVGTLLGRPDALPFTLLLGGAGITQLTDHLRLHLAGTEEPAPRTAPLSYGQQAQWFLYQLAPESSVYIMAGTLRIRSHLAGEALRRALRQIVERHAILRTRYAMRDGQLVQLIHARPEVDLTHKMVPDWSDEALREHLEQASLAPFDLEKEFPIRFRLLTRGPTDHVLLIAAHHIAIDFSSLLELLEELRALYQPDQVQALPVLPPLKQHYVDYVEWQQALVAGPEGERQWRYWREQLRGAARVLDLPTDRPRPPLQRYEGASYLLPVEPSLAEGLHDLARRMGVTSYVLWLTLFQLLLHRYTGQGDFIIGSPVSGRTQPPFRHLMGYLINILPLRSEVRSKRSFIDQAQQVHHLVLEALDHQDYPFPLLVDRLQPERDPSRSPLFQVMFLYEQVHDAALQGLPALLRGAEGIQLTLGPLEVEPFPISRPVSMFDLTLKVSEGASHPLISLEYNSDLFDPSTIERMGGHLLTLLAAAIRDPQTPVHALPLLSAEEQVQLARWNETHRRHPTSMIHQEIEAQVTRTPDGCALVFRETRLTYRELNEHVTHLARALRRLGVGAEQRVGLCMVRSVEMVVALLAVLKAGGAYVPLDPTYPAERLAYMLADADVSLLLTHGPARDALPPVEGRRIVELDREWDSLVAANEGGDHPPAPLDPANLAYIIYTSGSTGNPKGVMTSHSALANRLYWMQERYRLSPTDSVLQKTPFSFDVSVWEFLWPLMVGARLVVAEPQLHGDSRYLVETIRREEITTLHFVPSMLQLFLAHPEVATCDTVRQVVTSGEALSPVLVEDFSRRLPHSRLDNLYGPTEAAIDVSAWACVPHPTRVPIGSPIANVQLHVLDAYLGPQPVGVAGELYIGGVGVARGYLARPALTAEKFVPDPFSSEPGARLYRTGDLARWLPDGTIEYLGRMDRQVKLRGFRIELGEVEANLMQHPAIAACAVVVRPLSPGDPRLVAYIVASAGQPPTAVALRTFLQKQLAEYMIPSLFVPLDELPLSPNGKLAPERLPDPVPLAEEGRGSYLAPRDEVEEMLASLWAEVLRVERIGIHDHFFERGGHSLLAAQVLARLHDLSGIHLPLPYFFEAPTVARFAEFVRAVRAIQAGSLSPTQEDEWYEEGTL